VVTRTYSRDDYLRGKAEWAQYPDWEALRIMSSEWSCYPPSGSKWDQWDSESPTQSAIVARCWANNRPELLRIVGRSRSWSKVVASVIQLEARLDEDADQRERDLARDRTAFPDHVGAAMTLKSIMERIGNS